MRKPATWLRVATPETRRVACKPGPNILGPRPAVEPGLRRAAGRKLPGQGGTALVHRQTFQNRRGAGQRCCSGGGIPAAVNDLSERSRSQWASKVCECCRRPRHRFGCPRSVPKEAARKNEAGPRYGGRQQAVWWSKPSGEANYPTCWVAQLAGQLRRLEAAQLAFSSWSQLFC